ncbi:MAG: septum formation initiator family protein [Coriobacteriales bacterium]|jgi:cell division protein FtsB|nr:septum formation initiator family protein [Coriobacteriales bacterium]
MAKLNTTENAAVRIPPALIVSVVILLFLVLAAVMLYPVAREYYVAQRENDRLSAEYQAVLERNEKIRQQIDDLQTPEGIEDRAREEWGWVKQGEQAVNITGLNITDSSTGLPTAVESGSIKAPEDWWTQTLDEFFAVTPPKQKPQQDDIVPGL